MAPRRHPADGNLVGRQCAPPVHQFERGVDTLHPVDVFQPGDAVDQQFPAFLAQNCVDVAAGTDDDADVTVELRGDPADFLELGISELACFWDDHVVHGLEMGMSHL